MKDKTLKILLGIIAVNLCGWDIIYKILEY